MCTFEEFKELSLIVLHGGLILMGAAVIGVLSALLGSFIMVS